MEIRQTQGVKTGYNEFSFAATSWCGENRHFRQTRTRQSVKKSLIYIKIGVF